MPTDTNAATNEVNENVVIGTAVGITANAFEQDRKACMAAGMDDFVSKPIVPDVLRDVLARWLRPA